MSIQLLLVIGKCILLEMRSNQTYPIKRRFLKLETFQMFVILSDAFEGVFALWI